MWLNLPQISQLVQRHSGVRGFLILDTVFLPRSWCFLLETKGNKCIVWEERRLFSSFRDFLNVGSKSTLSFEELKPLVSWVSRQRVGQLGLWLGSSTGEYCICIRGSKIIEISILNIDLKCFRWNTRFLCCMRSDLWLHSSISVLKYKKNDEDESLKDKLSKLNIHSISKKSKRVTNHLKILTRGESQVTFLLGSHTVFSWGAWVLVFL